MSNGIDVRVLLEVDERGNKGCAVGKGDFEADAGCADVVRREVVG